MYDIDWYKQNVFPKLGRNPTVLTGISAFAYGKIDLAGVYTPEILTDKIELNGLIVYNRIKYVYCPKIDYNFEVEPFPGLRWILVPSTERAIVEIIKWEMDSVDQGYFYDILEAYCSSTSMYCERRLKRCCRYFSVEWEEVREHLEHAIGMQH